MSDNKQSDTKNENKKELAITFGDEEHVKTAKYRRGSSYLRIRVSPATIREGAVFLGNAFQITTGMKSILTDIKLKKMVERRQKIVDRMTTAKISTDIVAGLASAVSDLFSNRK